MLRIIRSHVPEPIKQALRPIIVSMINSVMLTPHVARARFHALDKWGGRIVFGKSHPLLG
jgi:hypothetical protein